MAGGRSGCPWSLLRRAKGALKRQWFVWKYDIVRDAVERARCVREEDERRCSRCYQVASVLRRSYDDELRAAGSRLDELVCEDRVVNCVIHGDRTHELDRSKNHATITKCLTSITDGHGITG